MGGLMIGILYSYGIQTRYETQMSIHCSSESHGSEWG